jgi:soluble lytic murein transglycosylase-like protein
MGNSSVVSSLPLRHRLATAAAVVALLATGSAAGRVHSVRRGDTLDALARRYQVSVPHLVAANGLGDPDHIEAGTTLVVPAVKARSAPRPSAPMGGRPAATRLIVRPVAAVRPASPRQSVAIPADRAHLRPLFVRSSRLAGVPADLAMALAWQESGWQRGKVSSTGAVGVMQLMPDTVAFVSRILLRQPANLDARDPAANIRMGTRFLRYLLDSSGGDVDTALASYYQGLRSVRQLGRLAETERFVANVKALRPRF